MKPSKNPRGITVFYSYASADKELRDRLANHLIQLERDELISEWHDQQILAGSDRAQAIDQAIHSAHIILLLISADFLASDYCYDTQMQLALERHKRGDAHVIPIILRDCDWRHSPLKSLQCFPRDGKPVIQWPDQDEVFHSITQDLRRVIEQQQALLRPPVLLSPINRQNRMRMLKQVQRIWIDGLLTKSLHHATSIALHLQDRPDVLANPWRLQIQELDQVPQSLPDGTTIVQVYDRAEGELLILGEPGAGKTTLLLELTATLLKRAERDEQLPMPIVFNLSSWANKRQPLRLWLVEELSTKYQVPRRIGQGWVDSDQILPLLDGLDEVAKEARSICVEQINGYYLSRLERGSSPMVVCCRSEEYVVLATRVMLQRAVGILPLTSEQINAYLEQAGEQVKGLRQALNEDTELYSLARQPLMLNIFTLAYQGAQASEVPTGETRKELQHTIFAAYVERMLRRRKQSKRRKPEQVIHFLWFLATQMQRHDLTVFSVENLQPTWLSRRWRMLYRWCIGLLVGLLFGPPVGALGGLLVGLLVGAFGGLFVGVLGGLLFGLFGGLPAGGLRGGGINPTEALAWSWKEARSGLLGGLLVGALGGLLFGLFGGLPGGLPGGLLFGLPVGLLGGLFGGLFGGLPVGLFGGLLGGLLGLLGGLSGRQLSERLTLSPNEGIWRSGKNGLFFGLLFGPLTGLLVGLVGALLVGLIGGLLSGLSGGIEAFVKHFTLRFFLSRQGNLPWNLVPFLDEATERLLLRKVGGSYIFVHRQLLDYFASLDESIISESVYEPNNLTNNNWTSE